MPPPFPFYRPPMMMRGFRPVLAGLIHLLLVSAVAAESYRNPVFEPVLADPSVVRAGDGFFYAYGTQDDWGDGEGSKRIPILRSRDLTDWEYVGEALEARPGWRSRGGLWAPDIARFKERYYLFYSISIWHDPNPGIGVAVAEHPAGPFQDKGKLFDSEEIGVKNSIDPQFFLDDGVPYLFWGSWNGIWGIELTADGLGYQGEKFQIAGEVFEAPYIHKRGGYYYFFGSLGSCCSGLQSTYRVATGRAESLKGPYLDRDGRNILESSGSLLISAGERFIAPGHNAVVSDDAGQDWLLYHAVDREEPLLPNRATRRPLMLDPLHWNGGWPEIKDGVPGEGKQARPTIR